MNASLGRTFLKVCTGCCSSSAVMWWLLLGTSTRCTTRPATPPDMEQLSSDDMEREEKFRVKSVCKVSSVLKKTTAAMPDLDKIILRASTQGSLKQLIRSTALVMRVFLADCRLNTDSVATRTDTSDRMQNKIDDAWLFLIKYD